MLLWKVVEISWESGGSNPAFLKMPVIS